MSTAGASHNSVEDQRARLTTLLADALPQAPAERVRGLIETLLLEERVRGLIETLTLLARPREILPAASPRAFRDFGKARSDLALMKLIRRVKSAEALVEELSAAEISRLAAGGVMCSGLTADLNRVAQAISSALAMPPPAAPSRARPYHGLAFVLAYQLLQVFAEAGYNWQQPISRGDGGGFTPLVQQVFAVLGIKDSAKAAAARAAREWSARHKNSATSVTKTLSGEGGFYPESDEAPITSVSGGQQVTREKSRPRASRSGR